MRVYVSATCPYAARYAAGVLRQYGHDVASTWHDSDGPPPSCEYLKKLAAARNKTQILSSGAVLILATFGKVPGAKFVEAGIALGAGRKVVAVGARENLMMFDECVGLVGSPEEAAALLQGVPLRRGPDLEIRELLEPDDDE